MPINANYDIETCSWCNGEGIDLSYKGQLRAPSCGRCSGSGKIYITDELSTTKRRRKYMGPVPKLDAAIERIAESNPTTAEELAKSIIDEALNLPPIESLPKRRGRPKKVASGNNPSQ